MPITPNELLELSKLLPKLGDSEVVQRCIVSRAYYACLHATDETFRGNSLRSRAEGESSHDHIIGKAMDFGRQLQPGRSSANEIAHLLPKLKRFRNAADYRIAEVLSNTQFKDVIERAEYVVELCADVERLRSKSSNAVFAGNDTRADDGNSPPPNVPSATGAKASLRRVK